MNGISYGKLARWSVILGISMLLLFLCKALYAEDVCVIDFNAVGLQSTLGKAGSTKISTMSDVYNHEIQKRKDELKKLLEDAQQLASDKVLYEQKMAEYNKAYIQLQRYTEDANRELLNAKQTQDRLITSSMEKALKTFTKLHNCAIVLPLTNTSFVDPKFNLTDQFLAYVNKK